MIATTGIESESGKFLAASCHLIEQEGLFTGHEGRFTKSETPFSGRESQFSERQMPFMRREGPFIARETPFIERETLFIARETATMVHETSFIAHGPATITRETPFIARETATIARETATIARERPFSERETPLFGGKTRPSPEKPWFLDSRRPPSVWFSSNWLSDIGFGYRLPAEMFAENSQIPSEWLEEFEAAARRPLKERWRYAFIKTYKPVMDDADFRSFDTMEEYRRWCAENLPRWLGYARV